MDKVMDLSQEIHGPVVPVGDDDLFARDTVPVPAGPLTLRIPTIGASASASAASGGNNGKGFASSAGSYLPSTTGAYSALSPAQPQQRRSAHQIVSGAGDEHHVITTPSGQVLHTQNMAGGRGMGLGTGMGGKRAGPNFSAIMNEYMGACMEDNCNIGKMRRNGGGEFNV